MADMLMGLILGMLTAGAVVGVTVAFRFVLRHIERVHEDVVYIGKSLDSFVLALADRSRAEVSAADLYGPSDDDDE